MKRSLNILTHLIGILTFLTGVNPYFILFSAMGYIVYLLVMIPRWHAFAHLSRIGLLVYPVVPPLCWIGIMLAS